MVDFHVNHDLALNPYLLSLCDPHTTYVLTIQKVIVLH